MMRFIRPRLRMPARIAVLGAVAAAVFAVGPGPRALGVAFAVLTGGLAAGYAIAAYYLLATAEASANLARYDGIRYGLRVNSEDHIALYETTRAQGFGAEVKLRIMLGTFALSAGYYDAYYLRAQKVRTLIKKDFEDCFAKGVNAILTPATPSAAFGIGEKGADPVEMYLNDIFTVTVNMAGLPGIAVPAGKDSQGLPLGLQLIGRPFDEETLFSLGEVIEQTAGRFTPPKWW